MPIARLSYLWLIGCSSKYIGICRSTKYAANIIRGTRHSSKKSAVDVAESRLPSPVSNVGPNSAANRPGSGNQPLGKRPTISSDPRSWWRGYVWLLNRFPWSAQLLSGATLGAISAVISELVVQRKSFNDIDWSVPARMFVIGLFILGPLIRGWFLALERIFPGSGGLVGLKRMLLDQTLMSPTVIAVFTTSFVLLDPKGGSLKKVAEKLEKDMWTILKNNWKVWPAVQMVTFSLIPLNLRLVFTSAVSMLWNIYIAFMFRGSNMSRESVRKPQP